MKIKYNKYNIYLLGKFGYLKIFLLKKFYLDINLLKYLLYCSWFEINCGWIGILFLNGLGFKCTKKMMFSDKKYWRFNVGHSHVFLYFSPKNIILKSKNRHVMIFGYKKSQIFDILEKIRGFHIPDVYKGVGLKYPNEVINLKKGKTRS